MLVPYNMFRVEIYIGVVCLIHLPTIYLVLVRDKVFDLVRFTENIFY